MGGKTSTVGGSPTSPLAQDFTTFLQGLMGSGSAYGSAGGGVNGANMGLIAKAIQGALSADPNDPNNANINKAIQQQVADDTDELRARYNFGGLSYSSPAAQGEAEYRARSAPNFMNALTARQLQALGMMIPAFMQGNALGTPQAQIIQEPSTFQNIMGGLTGLAGMAAPFFGPGGIFGKGAAPSTPFDSRSG